MRAWLADARGEGYIRICVAILLLATVLSAVLFYSQTAALVPEIREGVRMALDGSAKRAMRTASVKEKDGSEQGVYYSEADFAELFSSRFGGLTRTADGYANITPEGELLWEISKPEVSWSEEKEMRLDAVFTVTVPVVFAGETVTRIEIPMKVRCDLHQK